MNTVPDSPAATFKTVRQHFLDTASAAVEMPTADLAWRLVLDTWRVIEVASARAGVSPIVNRDEWMAALRIAIFRAEHDIIESEPFPAPAPASDGCGWSDCC
jgi:hypothetical protein